MGTDGEGDRARCGGASSLAFAAVDGLVAAEPGAASPQVTVQLHKGPPSTPAWAPIMKQPDGRNLPAAAQCQSGRSPGAAA